jgi:CRISPR-associated protein Csx17
MSILLHHLRGCSPAPLAHYLKAHGILRILAEQADPDVRGCWKDEHFIVLTKLTAREIESFFLERYEPTPFISPWNRGSGFYTQGSPLEEIEHSKAARLAPYRDAIQTARAQLPELMEADAQVRALKDSTKSVAGMSTEEKRAASARKSSKEFKAELSAAEARFKLAKERALPPCVRSWRGPQRDWLDAALVLSPDGNARWPSLLGTGGNDGRLDFTENAMKRILELFETDREGGEPKVGTCDSLRSALWAELATSHTPAAIGQFLPGTAGGANSGTGPDARALVNPWDFLLMLEGATVFSSRPTRRLDADTTEDASAPFSVRAHGAGNPTAGQEKSAHGEQWMPLWTGPATSEEVRGLIAEGRAQLGRSTAHRPLDVIRSVTQMGVARGISEFVRFGYLERNGRSNYAVPLGRVQVAERRLGHVADDLAAWADSLRRESGDASSPTRVGTSEQVLSDSLYAALAHDHQPSRWQTVLIAAAGVESILAHGTPLKSGPIPRLRPEWLTACDDGSAEWRLARALASVGSMAGPGAPSDPLRAHFLELSKGASSRIVAHGRNLVQDLAGIVQRRLVEASSRGQRLLPLSGRNGFAAELSDLAEFLAGHLDDERILSLARALMALDWAKASASTHLRQQPREQAVLWPDESWLCLRLAFLPWPLEDGRSCPADPGILRRLLSGDGASAFAMIQRRMHGLALRPPIHASFSDRGRARRMVAALAFPIDLRSAGLIARRLDPRTLLDSQS